MLLSGKVLSKMSYTVPKSTVKDVAECKPGVIEVVLANLRMKVRIPFCFARSGNEVMMHIRSNTVFCYLFHVFPQLQHIYALFLYMFMLTIFPSKLALRHE